MNEKDIRFVLLVTKGAGYLAVDIREPDLTRLDPMNVDRIMRAVVHSFSSYSRFAGARETRRVTGTIYAPSYGVGTWVEIDTETPVDFDPVLNRVEEVR